MAPRNVPFLTTREAFILKAAANGALRQEWIAAGPAGRRALLAAVAGLKLPRPGELVSGVTSEIEWFFTAVELCALLDATHGLPSLGINKGPIESRRWRNVAYKGGSEAGVLNLSALVVDGSGKRHCVVATWNDAEVLDPERLTAPFRALLRWLSREE